MYTVKYWLIKLKDPITVDDKEYTIHFIANTVEEAKNMAVERFGADRLAEDPVLDQTITYTHTENGILATSN